MSAYDTPIDNYDFGEAFNYSSWPKNTTVTMTNVPWNSDYRDVLRPDFDLSDWIDEQPGNLRLTHLSQKKFQQMTLDINTPFDDAMRFNYLRAENPLNPLQGASKRRAYYYFITDYEFIAGNNTRLVLQLDAWATFIADVKLGYCYVERSHLGIANERQFDNYGRDYLNVPEGLDVGGEYRIVKTASSDFMTLENYSVLVISAADMTKNAGTVKAPKLNAAKGSVVDGMISGASFYVFPTPGDYLKFQKLYADKPWITEAILSITVIPPINRYHADTLEDVSASITVAVKYDPTTITFVVDGQTITVTAPGGSVEVIQKDDFTMYNYPVSRSQSRDTTLAPHWRNTFLDDSLPPSLDAYKTLKKFLTYPYSVVELTTWVGQPLIVQPEAWADDNATVRELAVMVPPGQRIAFMPIRYNGDAATSDAGGAEDNAESLDFATTVSNFPTMPIVNNMAIGYLAANRNGLAFQRQAADWTQQRAMMGAQATEDVANADIRNTARQVSAGVTASGASARLSMETQNSLGLIGGALGTVGVGASGSSGTGGSGSSVGGSLNPMALAGYDATAGIKAAATAQQAAIEQAAMSSRGISSITAGSEVRDTNVSLARRAAKGNYMNDIAGINAKVQDAMLSQPSVAGQFGGDALNIAHNKAEVSARWKLLDNAAVRRIGNFWLRYGYAVQQFAEIPDDFMCMSKFTYWKLSETYITKAPIPEKFKQTIRGIFERGVTVWADPADIGTTAPFDNQPKSGISY